MGKSRILALIALWAACALAAGWLLASCVNGAEPDDYGPTLQAALNALVDDDPAWPDTSGGIVEISPGVHRVTTGVVIPCKGITIRGLTSATFASTLEWRGEGAMFTLRSPQEQIGRSSGFRVVDLMLRGRGENGTCFRFVDADVYDRGWRFERIAIRYFDRAFHFERGKSTGVPGFGAIECYQCDLSYNGQVVHCDGATINESRFRDCLIAKNGAKDGRRYAIDVRGAGQLIFDACVLERQPRVILARNVMGISILGCRLEGNDGGGNDPVMLFDGCSQIFLERCFHRVVQAEEESDAPTVLFRRCRDYSTTGSKFRRVVVEKRETIDENTWGAK